MQHRAILNEVRHNALQHCTKGKHLSLTTLRSSLRTSEQKAA